MVEMMGMMEATGEGDDGMIGVREVMGWWR